MCAISIACDVLWRRRPAGVFALRGDKKIAGETPAPRKPGFLTKPSACFPPKQEIA